MREIKATAVTEAIKNMCLDASYNLGEDTLAALKKADKEEESPLGKEALRQILENARIAREESLPLCQDCGTAVLFIELGQDLHITCGDLNGAIEEGVRQGYTTGYLRKSMVRQPYSSRVNTRDNTPPIIHTEIVPAAFNRRGKLGGKGRGSDPMPEI